VVGAAAQVAGPGRTQRGDVRTAVLLLLLGEPMHGYQIMQAMSDRNGGAWRPSPAAIYPTIAQLEGGGLVTTREEGGRRLVTLTSGGRAQLEEGSAQLGDPFADFANAPDRLHVAVCQIEVGVDATQLEAAANVLVQPRRSLYLILAGEAEDVGERVKAVFSLVLAHPSQLVDRFSTAQAQPRA